MTNFQKIKNESAFAKKLLFHPFNSFWEMKRENKGSMKAAVIINLLLVITLVLRRQNTGFILNFTDPADNNPLTQITGTLLLVLFWCVSCWSISTLLDGEQTLKEVFKSASYSLLPIVIFNIPLTLLSLVISQQEVPFYSILNVLSIIWTVFLFFVNILTNNQFSIKKTLLMMVISVLGVVVILFFIILFFAVSQQVFNFLLLIFKEITTH